MVQSRAGAMFCAEQARARSSDANTIAGEYEVPVEILAYLAKGTFDQIAITRTETKKLEAAIETAMRLCRGAGKTPIRVKDVVGRGLAPL